MKDLKIDYFLLVFDLMFFGSQFICTLATNWNNYCWCCMVPYCFFRLFINYVRKV